MQISYYCQCISAFQIYTDILANLPGYLVPKLVREIAGEQNKTPLSGVTIF